MVFAMAWQEPSMNWKFPQPGWVVFGIGLRLGIAPENRPGKVALALLLDDLDHLAAQGREIANQLPGPCSHCFLLSDL
jgi:hypothetical protein